MSRRITHKQSGLRRHTNWSRAKEAFGTASDAHEMLTRLELSADGVPEMLLSAAIHFYLCMPQSERSRVLRMYLKSLSCPAELLPIEELDPAHEAEFRRQVESFTGE